MYDIIRKARGGGEVAKKFNPAVRTYKWKAIYQN
jgi:hypothetical protein